MLPIVKRNDAWVLVFNIVCAIVLYVLVFPPETRILGESILFLIILVIHAVFINVFLERVALLPQKSHVPQFVTSLLILGLIPFSFLSYAMLIAFVLQQIVLLSLLLYNEKTTQHQKHAVFLFNQAILLSISFFLYPSFIYGILAFFISFIALFGLQVKQIIVFMTGLVFPLIYYLSYLYLFDVSGYELYLQKIHVSYNLEQSIFAGFILIFMIMGVYTIFIKLSNKNIHVRKSFQILFLYLLISMVGFFITHNSPVLILLSSTCLVFVLSFVVLNPKKPFLANMLFWLMLLIFFLRFISLKAVFNELI